MLHGSGTFLDVVSGAAGGPRHFWDTMTPCLVLQGAYDVSGTLSDVVSGPAENTVLLHHENWTPSTGYNILLRPGPKHI